MLENAPLDIFKLKKALSYSDTGQFKEAFLLCVELLDENPEEKDVLSICVDVARHGKFQSQATIALVSLSKNPGLSQDVRDHIKILLRQDDYYKEYARNLRGSIENYQPGPSFQLALLMAAIGEPELERRYTTLAQCLEGINISEGEIDLRQLFQSPDLSSKDTQEKPVERVCFVASAVTVRLPKLARALRSVGVHVTLITKTDQKISSVFEGDFDEVIRFEFEADCIELLIDRDASIYHFFPTAEKGAVLTIAGLVHDLSRCVIDFYDLSDPEIGPLRRFEKGSDAWKKYFQYTWYHRFLINHSPSICSRDVYSKALRPKFPGAELSNKRIFLPEFSLGTRPTRPKLSEADRKLHIVHGGTFFDDKAYGSKWPFTLLFAQYAEELDIHFHLYGQLWGEGDMSEYTELSQKSPNFHLHEQLKYEDWLSELEIYDAGIIQFPSGDAKMEGRIPRAMDPSGTWGNRFGDYIDAEIFLVCSREHHLMGFIAERYGIGKMGTDQNVLTQEFWDDIRQRVFESGVDFGRAHEELSILWHAKRLVSFYQKVTN
jgi:hypothetical protein